MIESLTHEQFDNLLQQRFEIVLEDSRIPCKLSECTVLKDGDQTSEGGRQPFSLIFVGPASPILPQATYRLEHDEMGALELFLVPVGCDEVGAQYQAVFA